MLRFANKISTNEVLPKYPVTAHNGAFKTYNRIKTDFMYGDEKYSRVFGAAQKFTWAGDVQVAIGPSVTSLAGIDKKLLTAEGSINLDAVLSELRNVTGLPTQQVYNHANNTVGWNWQDNHVALLINSMRAYFLKKLEEVGQLGSGYVPEYNDGHVKTEARGDQYDSTPYKFDWPSGDNDSDHPDWAHFFEPMPSIDVPYVDLRGNTQQESAFLLMMMARWKRTSNYIIDFDFPMLTDRMAYRSQFPVPGPNMRLDPEVTDYELKMPSSSEIWSAIRKYVSHNRLYNQFYTSAYLLAQIMVRPVANNAEGMAWTMSDPVMMIPKFASCRGRYTFINSGEAALIHATALEDWREIAPCPEMIFNASIVISSLVNIGLYSRSFKRALGVTGYDDAYTFETYLKPETFMASAMTEACGFDAPLNGMDSVFVHYPEDVDRDTLHYVKAKVYEPDGYDYDVDKGIKVIGVPLAVSPYMVYPLALFDGETPYSGKFTVMKPDKYTRSSARLSKRNAWLLAWASRIAGYDLEVKFSGDETGLSKFYADNDDSWTHIPYATLSDEVEFVALSAMKSRKHQFVLLPNMLNKTFATEFTVVTKVVDRYLIDADSNEIRSTEEGTIAQLPVTTGIQVITAGDVAKYWGSVRRTEQGLTLSGTIKPAVVPDSMTSSGRVDLASAGEGVDQE